MSSKNQNLVLGVILAAGIAVAAWMILRPRRPHRKTEGFATANDLNHLDSIDPNGPCGTAQPPDVPYLGQSVESSLDQAYGVPTAGEKFNSLLATNVSPLENSALPQFNVDVVNPANWTAQVQLRIPMKNRQFESSDPYRGDLAISRSPNSCVVDTSIYASRDSLRYDAFWSPYSNLARFNSAYMTSKPCGSSNGGTQCDA